jgi:hypothetical protein
VNLNLTFMGRFNMIDFKINHIVYVTFLTGIFFFPTTSVAATEGDSNQIDFALISDPHVNLRVHT